jgi:hypothetical protein
VRELTADSQQPTASIAARRIAAQQLVRPRFSTPEALVRWMGAMQAQDFAGAKWALASRLDQKLIERTFDAAYQAGRLIRTHALRTTWQWAAPEDLSWILTAAAPRALARATPRFLSLGLDGRTLSKSEKVFARALADGPQTRAELGAALRKSRIDPDGFQRLPHLLLHAELQRVACSGGLRGKQHTWAAYDARIPKTKSLTREQALTELARRYLQSRAPATRLDFIWWSGLNAAEARFALDAAAVPENTARVPPPPAALLLPFYDELLVGYRDRSAMLDAKDVKKVNAGGGLLSSCIVLDGRVAGLWKRTLSPKAVTVNVRPFRPLTPREREALAKEAERYAAFLELPLKLVL